MLYQVLHDSESGDLVLEIGILDSCLDGVKRGSDGDRGYSAGDGCDEILCPCCF